MAYAFLAFMVVVLVFALPVWPWSRGWGWVPTLMAAVILGTTLLFGFAGNVFTF